METGPTTYTAQQLAEMLQMPVDEVYRAGADEQIPGRIRIGSRTRFSARVIDRWLLEDVEEAA